MMKSWGVLAGVIGTAAVLTPQVTVAQLMTGQSATHVVLLDGEVTLCARGQSDQAGDCAVVAGACTAMTVTEFGDIVEHTSEQEKSELIGRHFEHISSQDGLLPEFQAPTGACPVFAQINPNQAPGGLGPAALGAVGLPAAGVGISTAKGLADGEDIINVPGVGDGGPPVSP